MLAWLGWFCKPEARPGAQSFQVILHLRWPSLLKWLIVCNLCLSQPRSSLLYLTRLHLSMHLPLADSCCWESNSPGRPRWLGEEQCGRYPERAQSCCSKEPV